MSLLSETLKHIRALRKLPTGEHAISTAARVLLDRDNNVVFDAEAISQARGADGDGSGEFNGNAIVAADKELTLAVGRQAIIYGDLTIYGTLSGGGELRLYPWPT